MSLFDKIFSDIPDAVWNLIAKGITDPWGYVVFKGAVKLGFPDPKYKDSELEHGKGGDPKTITGTIRENALVGSRSDDIIRGSGTVASQYGSTDRDQIYAGDGNDTVYGGAGISDQYDAADFISAGAGNDVVYANGGNDVILGGLGNDYINGGFGNDFIAGGAGSDTMTGAAEADTFAFASMYDAPVVQPNNQGTPDIITDFSQADGDKIDLSAIDAKFGTKANDSFRFIGGDYPNSKIGFAAGDVAAWHQGNSVFVQAWDGNTQGPSLLIQLQNFTGSLQATDFKL